MRLYKVLVGIVVSSNSSHAGNVVVNRAFTLLHSALRKAQPGLIANPFQLAGQLVGRLMSYGKVDDDDTSFYNEEIKVLLDNVMKWNGPDGGQGWWCPKRQTLEPAGGVCMMTLVNGEKVLSCAMSKDGKKIVVGGRMECCVYGMWILVNVCQC